jgi:hypothetical protein
MALRQHTARQDGPYAAECARGRLSATDVSWHPLRALMLLTARLVYKLKATPGICVTG